MFIPETCRVVLGNHTSKAKSSGSHESTSSIDDLCNELFDRWCESRSLVPLSYLLYAWPIVAVTPLKAERLIDALRDLTQFHRESLGVHDLKTISEVMVKCHEIL